MKRMFLIGLTVMALAGCNKASKPPESTAESKAPEAMADEESGPHAEGRGGHRRFCEGPDAEARIAKLMADAPAGAIGVKLSTPRRGCSGLAYSVDYVTEANPLDERIETPGGLFFIDGASVLYLIGSTMDWQEDDFTAGFVFQNPNAKGSCGCGESFTV